MKKIRLLSVVLAMITALGFISCDSEPVDPVLNPGGENPGTNPVGNANFKVDFGGSTFVATSAVAKYEQGMLIIAGAKTSGEVVSVGVSGTTEGTYNNNTMNYIPGVNAQTGYMNINPETFLKNGTVVITDVDYENNTVSGTFSFKGYSVNPATNPASIEFTNGTFQNVPATGLPQPGTVSEKYMRAKIDGELVNFGMVVTAGEGDFWVLTGTDAASMRTMTLNLDQAMTPGTYPLEMLTEYSALYMGGMGGIDIPSDTGTITIISHANGWIKGTFSFSGEDFDGIPHSVTNGEFNIQY
ncbi:DUF6252 family protein [Flavobacterium hauense]